MVPVPAGPLPAPAVVREDDERVPWLEPPEVAPEHPIHPLVGAVDALPVARDEVGVLPPRDRLRLREAPEEVPEDVDPPEVGEEEVGAMLALDLQGRLGEEEVLQV